MRGTQCCAESVQSTMMVTHRYTGVEPKKNGFYRYKTIKRKWEVLAYLFCDGRVCSYFISSSKDLKETRLNSNQVNP